MRIKIDDGTEIRECKLVKFIASDKQAYQFTAYSEDPKDLNRYDVYHNKKGGWYCVLNESIQEKSFKNMAFLPESGFAPNCQFFRL